jgi:hypothetical protein
MALVWFFQNSTLLTAGSMYEIIAFLRCKYSCFFDMINQNLMGGW